MDWFAFGITFGISSERKIFSENFFMLNGPLAVVLCLGMKESTKLNTVFTLLNVGVILFVLIGSRLRFKGFFIFQKYNLAIFFFLTGMPKEIWN